MSDFRHLSLRVAGKSRRQMHNGREHIVVPVVALMEGVIHAVNAQTPEYVPFSTLSANVHQWNGRPLMLNHPVRNGVHIAANDPTVLEEQSFGTIFNTRTDEIKRRLLMDAYVDPDRLKALGREDLLQRILEDAVIEVSVGAFVTTDPTPGTYNGKPYKASWKALGSDHLAFLPDSRGACSVEMGCGALRAACDKPEDDEVQTVDDEDDDKRSLVTRIAEAVMEALGGKGGRGPRGLAAKTEDCPACKGSGNMGGNPCEACDGSGELKVAENHQEDNMDRKALIDKLTTCECSGFTKGHLKMLEAATDEQLQGFVAATDAFMKKKEEEEAAMKEEEDKKVKAAAALKAAEDAKKSLEDKFTALQAEVATLRTATLTEEQFLERAPESIRVLVADKKNQDATEQAHLIKSLRAASETYSEEELTAMPLPQLRKLAAFAKIEAADTVDFRARGIPALRTAAAIAQYAPPDPYAAARSK